MTAAVRVSMIALGGPKLKLSVAMPMISRISVSMIALGGPKLKLCGAGFESLEV